MRELHKTFGIPLHIRMNVGASVDDIQAIKASLDNLVARKGRGAVLAWHWPTLVRP